MKRRRTVQVNAIKEVNFCDRGECRFIVYYRGGQKTNYFELDNDSETKEEKVGETCCLKN